MEPGRSAWRSYAHIADVLRSRIRTGEYPPGWMLPPETALSTEFGVVRNTLRRALTELDRERLIETVPGCGRRVRTDDGDPAEAPQYRRIAADLTAAVAAGELAPGSDLPSESALARRYGVSRGTARHALADLAAAGLVDTRQGRRRRVRPVQP